MGTTTSRGPASLLCALLLLPNVNLQSSDIRIGGRAVDTTGAPVPGIDVVLHRFSMATGGALLGSMTTDSAGRFLLTVSEAADTSAVYFAASRVDGQLYIGPFIRAPGADDYQLVIGGEAISLGDATGMPMTGIDPATTAAPPRNWSAPLLPAAALLALAAWALALAARPQRRRRLLIRLATLDEEMAESGVDSQRQRERDRILDRLLAD
jgi:hypothetical protein